MKTRGETKITKTIYIEMTLEEAQALSDAFTRTHNGVMVEVNYAYEFYQEFKFFTEPLDKAIDEAKGNTVPPWVSDADEGA